MKHRNKQADRTPKPFSQELDLELVGTLFDTIRTVAEHTETDESKGVQAKHAPWNSTMPGREGTPGWNDYVQLPEIAISGLGLVRDAQLRTIGHSTASNFDHAELSWKDTDGRSHHATMSRHDDGSITPSQDSMVGLPRPAEAAVSDELRAASHILGAYAARDIIEY